MNRDQTRGRTGFRIRWRNRGGWLRSRLSIWWPIGLTIVAGAVLTGILFLPPLLLAPYGISDSSQRFGDENSLRATMAGAVGGLALLVGAIVGALNFRETIRQNQSVLELQRRGQVTERFTKAIEQLGAEKLDVRIGGVYALEQIARDSPELRRPIEEVLTAYLRVHFQAIGDRVVPTEDHRRVPADAQAIATVVGRSRRSRESFIVLWPAFDREFKTFFGEHSRPHPVSDLHEVDLRYVHWEGADLTGMDLTGAWLDGAYLRGADLEGAYLAGAHLEGAILDCAQLEGANLEGAYLERASLQEANLVGAHLKAANLQRASLNRAQMTGANLREADMNNSELGARRMVIVGPDGRTHYPKTMPGAGADVTSVWFDGANLNGVDLREVVGLSWVRLRKAKNVDVTRLPPDVRADAERESATPDLDS